jgi:hypothetical protein
MPERVTSSERNPAPALSPLRRQVLTAAGALLLLPLAACSDEANTSATPTSASSSRASAGQNPNPNVAPIVDCSINPDGIATATVDTMTTKVTELGYQRKNDGTWVEKVTVYTSASTPGYFTPIVDNRGLSVPYSAVEAERPFQLFVDPVLGTKLMADTSGVPTDTSALITLTYHCNSAAPLTT